MNRLLFTLLCLPLFAFAAAPEIAVVIKDHRFNPAEIHVPAGKKVKLMIHNQDTTAEEFESHELNREKVIPGGARSAIFIGPLQAGKYPFFGEFNESTARGAVIAE